MAMCARYKTKETELYESGVPICLSCAAIRDAKAKEAPKHNRDIHGVLVKGLCNATTRADLAARDFNATINDIPSLIPHQNGTQHISNMAGELSAARKDMMDAHNRPNDFLARGIVPEDLKRSGT